MLDMRLTLISLSLTAGPTLDGRSSGFSALIHNVCRSGATRPERPTSGYSTRMNGPFRYTCTRVYPVESRSSAIRYFRFATSACYFGLQTISTSLSGKTGANTGSSCVRRIHPKADCRRGQGCGENNQFHDVPPFY
jgi:hypothetical protein